MREIKFRAINHETGKFVSGYYIRTLEGCRYIEYIIQHNKKFYIHDIKTLGQFTGLKDKNGVDIYEGDIIRWHDGNIILITLGNEILTLGYKHISQPDENVCYDIRLRRCDESAEVIGNKFDNDALIGDTE